MKTLDMLDVLDLMAQFSDQFDWDAMQGDPNFFVQPIFRITYEDNSIEADFKKYANREPEVQKRLHDILALFPHEVLRRKVSYSPDVALSRRLSMPRKDCYQWLYWIKQARHWSGEFECARIEFGFRGCEGKHYAVELTGDCDDYKKYVLTIEEGGSDIFRCFAPDAFYATSLDDFEEIRKFAIETGEYELIAPEKFTSFYRDTM